MIRASALTFIKLIVCTLLGISAPPVFARQCVPRWVPTFNAQPGVSGTVRTLKTFDDGLGGGESLYVGGSFETAGGIAASSIVKWGGHSKGWSPLGLGMNNYVEAMAVFDDGSGPALYAGGSFTTAGGVAANCIAKWNGTSWSPLGSGMTGGPGAVYVYALAVFDDGSGNGPALYAGGIFSFADGVPARNIAKWNGTSWSPLGFSFALHSVYALAVFDDGLAGGPSLYAGGSFGVRKWSGSTWTSLGGGLDDHVFALTVFDDGLGGGSALYAGGAFAAGGGLTADRIAKWDGTTWSPLDIGMGSIGNPWVNSLAVFDDRTGSGPALFAGGYFDTAGGVQVNKIAKWDGVAWHALGTGLTNSTGLDALAVFDDGSGGGPGLYAGGNIAIAGSSSAKNVAKWDGSSWSSLGKGVSDSVRALGVFDDVYDGGGTAMYVGGDFISAGDIPVNRIAKWDGASWSALGNGVNGSVFALAGFDDGSTNRIALFVGGAFETAGNVNAKRIAKWDGTSWSPLGEGMNSTVFALTVFDDGLGAGPALYAGGTFTLAGGVTARNIAKWDGSFWKPLGSGTSLTVYALTVFDDRSGKGPALYVGGAFDTAGGLMANRIAKWDGSNWSPLGSGMNLNDVRALTVFDDGTSAGPALYAGGDFTSAGGVSANRIAKWNGSQWSPLGRGTNSRVYALTVFDDAPGIGNEPALYAGGLFTTAGGVSANRIAKWNGYSWSSLGGGMNYAIQALCAFENDARTGPAIYVGGDFTVSPAGDSYYGKWQGCPANPPIPGDITGDGIVDSMDLHAVLNAWGLCPELPPRCPADIAPPPGGNGKVDVDDLLRVINNWG